MGDNRNSRRGRLRRGDEPPGSPTSANDEDRDLRIRAGSGLGFQRLDNLGVVPSSTDFTWVGRLQKRRGGFGKIAANNWKSRCFVVTKNGFLIYFEEENFDQIDFSRDPRGSLYLGNEITMTASRQDSDTPTLFGLVLKDNKGTSWHLCASTEIELLQLQKVISDRLNGGNMLTEAPAAGKQELPERAHSVVPGGRTHRSASRMISAAHKIENQRSYLYFLMLLIVNSVLIIVSKWEIQVEDWRFCVAMTIVCLAIALCCPRKVPVFGVEGTDTVVPLVHPHDVIPLVKSIKMMDFVKRKREELARATAATTNSGSAVELSIPIIRPAGKSFPQAIGYAAGDLNSPANTWQEGNAKMFSVRGAAYMTDKKKDPSLPAFYEMKGMDLFKTKAIVRNISDMHVSLAAIAKTALPSNNPDVPQLLVINVLVPCGQANLMGTSEDRPGYQMVLYFSISSQASEAMLNLAQATPAERLWATYCSKFASDDAFRGRLKVMALIANWSDELGLNSFRQFNGKPVLITKSGQCFAGKPASAGGVSCLEIDINVHRFSIAARRGLHYMSDKFKSMILQVGFTIEGRCPEELPETVLACSVLNYPDLESAEELECGLPDDDDVQ